MSLPMSSQFELPFKFPRAHRARIFASVRLSDCSSLMRIKVTVKSVLAIESPRTLRTLELELAWRTWLWIFILSLKLKKLSPMWKLVMWSLRLDLFLNVFSHFSHLNSGWLSKFWIISLSSQKKCFKTFSKSIPYLNVNACVCRRIGYWQVFFRKFCIHISFFEGHYQLKNCIFKDIYWRKYPNDRSCVPWARISTQNACHILHKRMDSFA